MLYTIKVNFATGVEAAMAKSSQAAMLAAIKDLLFDSVISPLCGYYKNPMTIHLMPYTTGHGLYSAKLAIRTWAIYRRSLYIKVTTFEQIQKDWFIRHCRLDLEELKGFSQAQYTERLALGVI
ncbi:hypothetical protein RUND412_002504 [Rhizina undulata]